VARDRLAVDLRGLGQELGQRSQALGLDRSTLVRQILAAALSRSPEQTAPATASSESVGPSNDDQRRRISLRVSAETHAKIVATAKARGSFLSEYLEDVLTDPAAAPAAGPRRVPPEVLEAFVRSNYELRAVGRNINQIAHSLNSSSPGGTLPAREREALTRLPSQIAEHVEVAAKALHALAPAYSLQHPIRKRNRK
jgi:hypothetical protein